MLLDRLQIFVRECCVKVDSRNSSFFTPCSDCCSRWVLKYVEHVFAKCEIYTINDSQLSVVVKNSKHVAQFHFYLLTFNNSQYSCIFFSIPGTKSDLRVHGSDKFVTVAEGKKLRNRINAYSIVECSAKKRNNLSFVFEESIRAVEKKKHGSRKNNCTIL